MRYDIQAVHALARHLVPLRAAQTGFLASTDKTPDVNNNIDEFCRLGKLQTYSFAAC